MKKQFYFSRLKRGVLAGLVMLAGMAPVSLSAQDTTTGLQLHYTFDNVDAGVVPDASGNNLGGTMMGAATTIAGKSGQGASLAVQADYVLAPTGAVASLTNFTVAAWVKLDAVNSWARLFDFGSSTTQYMFLSPKSGSGAIRFAIKNGGGEQVINGPSPLTAAAWTHVAVTCAYDANGTGLGKLYVNGALVGSNAAITITPAMLGQTTQNYIGKSQFNDPALAGVVDDFRVYGRALTEDDVFALNGVPAELITQWRNLALGDLSAVESNLTLPSALGTQGVAVSWASSNTAVVALDGTVTRPQDYNATVKLTATVTLVSGEQTYTLTKEFLATVTALNAGSELLAQWDFAAASVKVNGGVTTVTDASEKAFVGTVMNEARIRTIGESTKYNVLDLGNGTGYFDMGTDIGKAIYSLGSYTMCAYFRIDETYSALNSNGNFIWTFSNSANSPVDMNGYIIGSLKNQAQNVSTKYWKEGDQGVGLNTNAAKGGWHHIAFTQNGTTGTIFIDGVKVAENTGMTNIPSVALPKEGLTGTLYNWLGRSCYPTDAYLRQTLLYDFRLYSVPMSADDIAAILEAPSVIVALDAAYAENPEYVAPTLSVEADNLNLGDLTAVIGNLTLPATGTLDNTITIGWKSSVSAIIDPTGAVNRPDFYNRKVTLTATLMKDGSSFVKTFEATVVAKEGSAFANDLLVDFNFAAANVNGTSVTDMAEKKFVGTLVNDAKVRTIGLEGNQFGVLDLGNGTGYFDMGTEVGKVMYGLNDYTMGAYFRINDAYDALNSNGNFIWSFSNSNNSLTDKNGYIIGSLKEQSQSITPFVYNDGNQTVSLAANAMKGGWHHFAYTQLGTKGTLYIDGWPLLEAEITNLPSASLPKDERLGTLYNWLGRSCYASDVYLRKTLLHDFRLYGRALTADEIEASLIAATTTIEALDLAYAANANEPVSAVEQVSGLSGVSLTVSGGQIRLGGLTNQTVTVCNIAGQQIRVANPAAIAVAPGIYVVRVGNQAVKVMVR